jgi:hypothetical protein
MPLDMALERAASGMLEVVVAAMAKAVRPITLEHGLNPRDFALVAYGGQRLWLPDYAPGSDAMKAEMVRYNIQRGCHADFVYFG